MRDEMTRKLIAVWFACFLVSSIGAQAPTDDKALAELKSRKPQDSAAIRSRTEKLSSLDADSLEAELKSLQDLHGLNRENWNKMQAARRLDTAATLAVEARSAKYTLKLWQTQKAYDNKMQSLKEAEEKAFQQKFNESYSKSADNLTNWNNSSQGKALQNDRTLAEQKYRDSMKSLTEEAGHGNAANQKTLDDLQNQILDDFQVTANAVNKARELLENIKKPEEPSPTEKPKVSSPPTSQATEPSTKQIEAQYNLQVKIDYSLDPPEIAETDEYFELTVIVTNGKGPFRITMLTSAGDMKEVTLTEPGSRTFPCAFKTVGFPHRVEFTIVDAGGLSRTIVHPITIHLPHMGKKDYPLDAAKTGIPKSPPPTTPPTPPPPLLAPMSGSYRAHLWCVGLVPVPPGVGGYTDNPIKPVPVSLSFDPNGQVSGSCNYVAPYTMFDSIHRRRYSSYEWKVQFTIKGTVDWQTGIMQLSLPDIRANAFMQNDIVRTEYLEEVSATFQGRHTSDPYWSKYLARMGLIAGQLGMKNLDEKEQFGNPNFVLGPQGKYRFANDGWYGAMGDHPGITAATGAYKVKTLTLKTKDSVRKSDLTTEYQKSFTDLVAKKQLSWYLKIIGREATPKDLVQLDLVATTISPERTIAVAPNETIFVQFMGVFSDDFSSPRELTNVCEWQVPPGVIQVRPGVFQAAKPGIYEIRARAKGRSSNWMEGVVTMEVK